MTKNRSSTEASKHRVVGRPVHQIRVGLALAFLALVGLTQAGCRSSGCSSCDIGSKLTNGVQALGARVFNHKDKGCSTCGTLGSYEEGTVIDSGIPVVTPGVVVPAPGTIVPPPTEIDSSPRLEALPAPAGAASSTAAPTTSNRTPPGANRSAYEASSSRTGIVASKRGSDLSRAYQPSAPTQAAYAPEEPDVLDHLPPVDLPSELSRKVTSIEEAASPAKDASGTDGTRDSSSSAPPSLPPAEPNPRTTSAEKNSAGGGFVSAPTSPVRATPGIIRSASVAPSLAGGSLPSADGLAWLKEKGYRTLVDLRPRSEVEPGFPDQVTDNGMLYVAIPFATSPINLSRLVRFNDLMGQTEQRPLYFCDTDGRRAGLIWYLRLRSQDREEAASARSKAEEIGLNLADLVEAEKFLKLNFAATHDPEPASIAPEPQVSAVSTSIPVSTPAPIKTEVAHVQPVSTKFEPLSLNPSWKPVAALVLSGLGVPLAYWSSSSLTQKRGPRRASLTAKGPGTRKSLPSSDA